METVLLTGAFGNVGRSTVQALVAEGRLVKTFDRPSRANRAAAKAVVRAAPAGRIQCLWGDIRDSQQLASAMAGVDAVVHLAAIIPPAADQNPSLAASVNIGGTQAVIQAMQTVCPNAALVYSSSVACYGDRVRNYFIKTSDPLIPCEDDEYAKQKTACEALVRASGLSWTICRLSYIVWRKKLAMDALMYRMPLDTRIEVCHTLDTGLALARAAFCTQARGQTYNLAGGLSCRTTFRAYLDRMLGIFGLGGASFLPEEAFSAKGYHCGWMDTDEAQRLFGFQRYSLEDYYKEVEAEARSIRPWARMFRPIARASVLARSPYLRAYYAKGGLRALLHPAVSKTSIGRL